MTTDPSLIADYERDIVARLYATDDAAVWAEEFMNIYSLLQAAGQDIDFGLMVGWFANAIETAKRIALNDGSIAP